MQDSEICSPAATIDGNKMVMTSNALARALTALRCAHNDLRIVAGDDVNRSGFTLLAILRNEIYFLPDFLAHYRKLGVERFVFLNDRSSDGSFEYLLEQPDAVVVESGRTYGDKIEMPPSLAGRFKDPRMLLLWRSMLHEMFARDRWALQVDLDEFVHLPEGMTFQDLVARLEKQSARAVWGVMLDVYPKDIAELAAQKGAPRLDTSTTWYFDGERHLRLRWGQGPKIVHPGARARLYHAYGVDWLNSESGVSMGKVYREWLRKVFFNRKPPKYNSLVKPMLLKWKDDSFFKSSHQTNLPASADYLLPIQHFRFAGSLYGKVQTGIREKSYHRGSFDHRLLSELLRTMEERNGSFLYPKSRPLESFEDLARTQNAFGL